MIENEEVFQRDFGAGVIAGMLKQDLSGSKMGGRASFEQDRGRVMQFINAWKKFDWTAELDG